MNKKTFDRIKYLYDNLEKPIEELASDLKIGVHHLLWFCKEHNVPIVRKRKKRKEQAPGKKTQWFIQYMVDNPNKGLMEYAGILGVTRQRVHQICKKYNLPYKRFKHHSAKGQYYLTDEQKEYLQLNVGKKSIKDISAAIDVKEYEINKYVKNEMKGAISFQARRRNEMMDLIRANNNKTLDELCEITGLRKNNLCDFCKRYNLEYYDKRMKAVCTKEQKEKIYNERLEYIKRNAHKSKAKLARELNISAVMVYRMCKMNNITVRDKTEKSERSSKRRSQNNSN